MICTASWGGVLIFPLAFMFCNWWKKVVYPAFEIPETTYHALQVLLSAPNMETISLSFVDNCLTKVKTEIMYKIFSRATSLKSLTFVNGAGMFDYENQEFTNFKDNFLPIKRLPILSDIRWG